MKSISAIPFSSLFFLLLFTLLLGCDTGASPEDTEEPAEEANEEMLAGDAEDDAEYLTEAYSYGLMIQAYNQMALAKANAPAQVKDLANSLNEFQGQFNSSIDQLAQGQVSGVTLPDQVGENVLDYIENLQNEEDADDFAEDYFDVLQDIFDRLENTIEDAAEDSANTALNSWGQQRLQEVRNWQQRLQEAEEAADAVE